MLPIMTTVDDINAWISFLKNKINGANLKDAESIIGRNFIDGRKLSGLQYWGFISKSGDHITLTPMGWDFSRATPLMRGELIRKIVGSILPYKSILEWAHFQNLDQLTTIDVGSRWIQFNMDHVETENETTLNYNAICFFHVAQAAGLGKLVVGRRGQPTRLELDHTAIATLLETSPDDGRQDIGTSPDTTHSDGKTLDGEIDNVENPENLQPTTLPVSSVTTTEAVEQVFVGHSGNGEILDQVKTILTFGKFEAVIAEEEETTAVPVPQKVMDAMHRCQAAIMNISADGPLTSNGGDQFTINDNVLIEVGAAFVLYNKNVILLVDDRVQLPSNLQGLYECRYHGDSLDFASTMRLQQALIKFRDGGN